MPFGDSLSVTIGRRGESREASRVLYRLVRENRGRVDISRNDSLDIVLSRWQVVLSIGFEEHEIYKIP